MEGSRQEIFGLIDQAGKIEEANRWPYPTTILGGQGGHELQKIEIKS